MKVVAFAQCARFGTTTPLLILCLLFNAFSACSGADGPTAHVFPNSTDCMVLGAQNYSGDVRINTLGDVAIDGAISVSGSDVMGVSTPRSRSNDQTSNVPIPGRVRS